MYAHAYLCAGIPEPPRGERGAAYGPPSAVSDQLTALVSQAYQIGENSSCFSTTSDQLVVLASSPEKGFFVRGWRRTSRAVVGRRAPPHVGGAAIGRGTETEDTAVVRIRQYKQGKRQYSTVVCVSAYRRWRCVVQSFLPLADYSEVFRKCPCARVDTMSSRTNRLSSYGDRVVFRRVTEKRR